MNEQWVSGIFRRIGRFVSRSAAAFGSYVRTFFRTNRSILLIWLFFVLCLFWVYRAGAATIMREIYNESFPYSVFSVIGLSLTQDVLALLLVLLLIVPVLLLPRRFRRMRYSFLAIELVLVSVMLFIGLGHIQIFETPLSLKMLGQGLGTIWEEIVNSALYEIPPQLYHFLAFLGGAVILFSISRYFAEKHRFHNRRRHGILFASVSWLIVGALAGFVVTRELEARDFGEQVPAQDGQRGRRLTDDVIARNPLKTLVLHPFSSSEEETEQKKKITFSEESLREFSYGLDTDSLDNPRFFPRTQLPRGKKYNIIFYFFESTHAKYVGMKYKGKSVTPTWDRLQENSFVAPKHYTHFPLSVNAMWSVLSSAYDHHTKTYIPMSYPWVKIRSLPEILKEGGYRTSVFQSSSLKCFDHRGYLQKRKLDKIMEMRHFMEKGVPKYTPLSVDDREMIEPAVKFMKEDAEKPFFVSFFPLMPHHPYKVPDQSYHIVPKWRINQEKDFKKRSWLRYHNALHFADAALGQLIDRLKEEKLLKNTIIFVFGDHGEAFYQHKQNYTHSLFIYEETVHVPMLIYNPELFSEKYVYKGVSRHIDLLPTVLDLVGMPTDPEHEGISLFAAHKQQMALLHTYWNRDFQGIRDGRWKYILWVKRGYEELYDLYEDPGEKINLAEKHPDIAQRYREYVKQAREYKKLYYYKVFRK